MSGRGGLLRRWVLCAGVLLVSPAGTAAQEMVRGRIVEEETGRAVGLAQVQLVRGDSVVVGSVSADSAGYFRILLEAPGDYRLQAGRLGYTVRTSLPFRVDPGETVDIFFELAPLPVDLDPLNVQGRGRRTGRDKFAERQALGEGFFVDREAIDELDPRELGDIFRIVEGVDLLWRMQTHDDGDRRLTPAVRSRSGRGCFAFAVDDHVIMSNRNNPWLTFPLSGLGPDEIMGVEVYRDLSEVPQELRNSAYLPVFGRHDRVVGSSRSNQAAGTVTTRWYEEQTCGFIVFRTKSSWN